MISQRRHLPQARAAQAGLLFLFSLVSLHSSEAPLPAQDINIGIDQRSEVGQWLRKELNDREALIWYLSHCGYAVKTKSALLIFDYWEKGRDLGSEDGPQPLSLADGRINPVEIKDLNVYVFVTHAHLDHYDQVIFKWGNTIKDISYIFGWHAQENPAYHYLAGPRSELNIDGMQISTINESHDGKSGVCYQVNVDGLRLYFSGDYGWAMLNSFKDDFDYLSGKAKSIDIAFLSPCYYQQDSNLVKLEIPSYFIRKFSPKIVFPQHFGGREELMAKLVGRTREDFPQTKFESPRARGERWHVRLDRTVQRYR